MSQGSLRALPDLPAHQSHGDPESESLAITGLVEGSRILTFDEVNRMTKVKLTEDFKCLEGWVVRDVSWEGVRVSDLLRLVQPDRAARWVLFGSGHYTTTISLRTAFRNTTILALRKSGRGLTRGQGGPYRLVFMGHKCYESVKRVNRIVVLCKPIQGTARAIATARIRG